MRAARQGKLLRIAVSTKGCSGMSYDMSWVEEAGPQDEVVASHGLRCWWTARRRCS